MLDKWFHGPRLPFKHALDRDILHVNCRLISDHCPSRPLSFARFIKKGTELSPDANVPQCHYYFEVLCSYSSIFSV